MLLVPDRLAAVAIHLPLDSAPGVTVPIGFVTRNRRKVEIARRLFLEIAGNTRFIQPPTPKGGNAHDATTSEEAYGNLNYTPIVFDERGVSPFQV